jgi:branched-chain amino acid transport system substrate-binding protein
MVKRSRHTRLALVGAGAVAVAVTLAACSSSGASGSGASSSGVKGNYVIGFSDGLTGALAPFSSGELQWTKAVFNAANAAGGINGHKIELKVLDQGDPGSGEAPANVIQLATSDHVSAIIGEIADSDCASIATTADRYTTPVICQFGAAAEMNPPNKYIFMAADLATMEVAPQIAFVKTLTHNAHPRVAVFTGPLPGPIAWAHDWASTAPKEGVTVTTLQTEAATATNVDANIAAIVASRPDAVVLTIYPQFIEPLIKGLAAAGLHIPIIGASSSINSSTFNSIGQSDLYNTTVTVPATVGASSNSAGLNATLAQMAKLGASTTDQLNDSSGTHVAVGPYMVISALKECGYPCDGQQMDNALEKASTNADGLLPATFAYSPTSHIGIKDIVFTHLDPSTKALVVALIEPAGDAFPAG